MVDESEMQDFRRSIKQRGFEEADFELTKQKDPTSGGGIYSITGTLTIKHKSNGKVKSYKTGYGSSWPVQFYEDLAQGVFGAPKA